MGPEVSSNRLTIYIPSSLPFSVCLHDWFAELFLRGRPYLCLKMKRMKNKGVGKKPLPDPENEPDFYIMPYVGVPGEAQHDPHGVLPPGYNEVDSLLEKIRGNGKSAKGGRTNHLHPNPHAHQFQQHPQFQHPHANPNQSVFCA